MTHKKYIMVVILCTGWTDLLEKTCCMLWIWLFAGGVVEFDGGWDKGTVEARGFAIHHVKAAVGEEGEIVIQGMSGVNDNTSDNGNTSF